MGVHPSNHHDITQLYMGYGLYIIVYIWSCIRLYKHLGTQMHIQVRAAHSVSRLHTMTSRSLGDPAVLGSEFDTSKWLPFGQTWQRKSSPKISLDDVLIEMPIEIMVYYVRKLQPDIFSHQMLATTVKSCRHQQHHGQHTQTITSIQTQTVYILEDS